MATATAPRKKSSNSSRASSQNGGDSRASRAKSGGRSAPARPAAGKAAGRAAPTRATAKQGLKAAAEGGGEGAGKFETLTAFWRVGRLAWKVARGKRPKAKQLRKAASSATEVGAKALASKAGTRRLASKASKLPLRKLGQAVGRVRVKELPHRVRGLPVQRSVDVAVPLEVAYAEWMRLESLPEGAHRVCRIERRAGLLVGELDGLGEPQEWEAEIRDERLNESFAWRSTRGSDVAGLVTFHRLSERLTRLELQLDVVPTGVGEAASLALHLADHRAESELRRFKSRLETISPDVYPSLVETPKPKTSRSPADKRSHASKRSSASKRPTTNRQSSASKRSTANNRSAANGRSTTNKGSTTNKRSTKGKGSTANTRSAKKKNKEE